MILQGYLKVKKTGEVEIFRYKPNTLASEIVVLLNLTIPDILFDRPPLEVNITVKDASKPPQEVIIESGALMDWIEKK